MQHFCLTILTFRVTFRPLTFCVSRDLKFSLNHNTKQLFTLNLNSGICYPPMWLFEAQVPFRLPLAHRTEKGGN